MPENTNNDAPAADRPTARADQEGPGRTGAPARPVREVEAEQAAREAVGRGARQMEAEDGGGPSPEPAAPDASPTDIAPA